MTNSATPQNQPLQEGEVIQQNNVQKEFQSSPLADASAFQLAYFDREHETMALRSFGNLKDLADYMSQYVDPKDPEFFIVYGRQVHVTSRKAVDSITFGDQTFNIEK